MSERWEALRPSTNQEFFLSVELYLSAAAALALPKITKPYKPVPRQRRERLELSSSAQQEERKVKVGSHYRKDFQEVHGDQLRASSLEKENDVFSTFTSTNQLWTAIHAAEPIYLHFPSSETCNTWLALLRSFAVPEIHGRLLFPDEGGSYRMWRQLELTVVQGRGLSTGKLLENGLPGDVGESDDFTVSCDVYLNGILCGRTSEKRGTGCPDWLENFTFSDLPPFDSLVLLVRRDKKTMKTTTTLNSRNFLDWIDDLENKLKMKNVTQHLMPLAIDRDIVISHVEELAAREVNAASLAQNTLFRGNTTLSRVMELCMNWYGKTFLEASVGGVIRKLCREKIAIEVDPARRNKGSKDIERNFELLTTWCQEFLDQIYAVRTECPHQGPAKFGKPEYGYYYSKWYNPLVVSILICTHQKSFKEEYMRGMAGFIAESTPAMIEYIVVVSTADKDPHNHPVPNNKREQLEIETYLRRRSLTLQVLDKEAIPRLPDLVDIPRYLAVITSAVIRHSAELQARPKSYEPADQKLGEICSKCLDVEEQALLRVSQSKAKASGHQVTLPLGMC
ncbi:hypothetical protein C0992_005425 [Termitomyces sp. T32_za158]|nr:hypothetical protein C0992_005425 [Termitomyces sp. T32_za158]